MSIYQMNSVYVIVKLFFFFFAKYNLCSKAGFQFHTHSYFISISICSFVQSKWYLRLKISVQGPFKAEFHAMQNGL